MGRVYESKYGPLEIGRPTVEEEPAFLLRAKDDLSLVALHAYAQALRAAAAGAGEANPGVDTPRRLMVMADRVLEEADRFQRWRLHHPTLVRLPD